MGRINLVLTPDESQEFANKFYKACEDSSISRTATFGLLERVGNHLLLLALLALT